METEQSMRRKIGQSRRKMRQTQSSETLLGDYSVLLASSNDWLAARFLEHFWVSATGFPRLGGIAEVAGNPRLGVKAGEWRLAVSQAVRTLIVGGNSEWGES